MAFVLIPKRCMNTMAATFMKAIAILVSNQIPIITDHEFEALIETDEELKRIYPFQIRSVLQRFKGCQIFHH